MNPFSHITPALAGQILTALAVTAVIAVAIGGTFAHKADEYYGIDQDVLNAIDALKAIHRPVGEPIGLSPQTKAHSMPSKTTQIALARWDGPSTPAHLELIADAVELHMNDVHYGPARLRALALEMTQRDAILAAIGDDKTARGDVIARLIADLAENVQQQLTTRILPDDGEALHSALITEGAEFAERLTLAGLAASRFERQANEAEAQAKQRGIEHGIAVDIIDAQKECIRELRGELAAVGVALSEMADRLEAERGRTIRFVFIETDNPMDMGVEQAADLMMALELSGTVAAA